MIGIDTKKQDTKKAEIETVQQQKQEYHIVGSFHRTKGTKLFSYNPIDHSLVEVTINYSETIHTVLTREGWTTIDFESQKATVDTRFIYFEAINIRTAKVRVSKYKSDLSKLCNLQPVRNGKINF